MRWYKRLSFKIFLSIWFASFIVLVATILILGAVSERERFRDVVAATAQGYAERVIDRYEANGLRPPKLLPRRDDHRHDHHDDDDDKGSARRDGRDSERFIRWQQRELLRVTDLALERRVIGPPPEAWGRNLEVMTFELRSESGRQYRIDVALNWQHSPVGHFLRTLLSVQVVLILLVSALASSLLTWIIVRPINRLREHTRAISDGALATRSDRQLNRRGDEIGELSREFDRMAEYVEHTLTSHQKLLQDVSHELRAPLARLQAAAGLAEQRWGEDKVVTRIMRECQRLDALIGEILSLSRLDNEAGTGEPFALEGAIQEWVEDCRLTAPAHRIEFTPPPHSCVAALNRALLERALNNILGNACKHTPEQTLIEVTLTRQGAGCVIRVHDHGPGVTAEALPHLFDPFYRSTQSDNGYGLGLSIAQRAVQRLGGSIEAHNHPEGGLEVCLSLPCQP